MGIAEIKASITKMNARQRREIEIHLLSLRAATPAWKKETARRIRDAKAGKSFTATQVEALIAAMPR
jgi:hypothetical protein